MIGRKSSAGMGMLVLIAVAVAATGVFTHFFSGGFEGITGAAVYQVPSFCTNPGEDDYIGCIDLNADGKVNYTDEEIFSQILAGIITDPEILVYADFDGDGAVDNLVDFQQCFVSLRDYYKDNFDGNVSCNRRNNEDNTTGAPDRTGCTGGCPDLNSDGYVDRADLDMMRLIDNGSLSDDYYPMSDLTEDNETDINDIYCWQLFRYTYVTCNLPVHYNHTNIEACADLRDEFGTNNDAFVNDHDLALFESYKDSQDLQADFNDDTKVNWLDQFVFREYYDNGMVGCDIYHAPWHTGGIDQYSNASNVNGAHLLASSYNYTQSFNSSYDGFLTKVRLGIAKPSGSGGGLTDLTVTIWDSDASGAPNTSVVFGTSVYKNFQTNVTYNNRLWVTVPFIKPPYLEKNHTYHIAVKTSSDSQYYWLSDNAGLYSGGKAWNNTAGSWAEIASDDFFFYTYMTTACADLNADGFVDEYDNDIIDAVPDGMTPSGTPGWNSSFDFNNDSVIDAIDAGVISATGLDDVKALVDQQTTGSPDASFNFGKNISLAQPFTSGFSGPLYLLNLSISKGTGGSSILVEIRDYDGASINMSGAALASSTLSTIGYQNFTWHIVSFTSPAVLTQTQKYVIVLSSSAAGTPTAYNWSNCSDSAPLESFITLERNASGSYTQTQNSSLLCFNTYSGNTLNFNDTLDLNGDNVINSTDYNIILAADGALSGDSWSPIFDFNARFGVYEKTLDKGLGFDTYMSKVETCGFPYYLKHLCGDGRCSMKYPYNENYQNCAQDCPPCNYDGFCAVSENYAACPDCTAISEGVEYSRFKCGTTDFDNLTSLDSLTNVVIEDCNYGKILFPGPVNMSGTNLDSFVNITYNNISIDTSAQPNLNKPAILTLYNLSLVYPVITNNSVLCEGISCGFTSYDGRNLEFSVIGFNPPKTYYSSVDVAPDTLAFDQNLSTNFTRHLFVPDITSLSNAVFAVSGEASVTFTEEVNYTLMNVSSGITINYNEIEVHVGDEPRLDTGAEVTLFGINSTYPVIKECPGGTNVSCEGSTCAFSSYSKGNYLTFTVTEFPDGSPLCTNDMAPLASKFSGSTTNFVRGMGGFSGGIESASGVVLDIPMYGKIEFTQPINVSRLDANNLVNITRNNITLGLSADSRLNKSANITFYNVTFVYPQMYIDGVKCSACSFQYFDESNNFAFNISRYNGYETPSVTLAEAAPNVSAFSGSTTNFSRRLISNIESVSGLVLEKPPYSRLQFTSAINVTNTNLSWSDTENIGLTSTGIFINSTRMPGLNKSALLTFSNLSFHYPRVFAGGVPCPSSVCGIVLYPFQSGCYNNCTMLLSISDFRYNQYLVVENNTLPQFVNGPMPDIAFRENRDYLIENINSYFFDADNQTLVYSVINATPATACTSLTFELSGVSPVHLNITPAFGYSGECRIRINASDGNNFTLSNSFLITVIANSAPVFAGPVPEQSWDEDTSRALSLSSYFIEPDGDNITFSYKFVGAVKDSNISMSVDSSTNNATLVPAADFFGTRYMVITASDEEYNVSSNYITLNVNPVNDAPVCSYVYNVIQAEDTNVTIDMASYCSDVDDSTSSLNMSLSSPSPNFDVAIRANKTFLFVPHPNWNGYESFKINVTDPSGLKTQTNEFVISLSQVADIVVVANSYLAITIPRDTNYTFNASDYVYDPDNSAIYYYTRPSGSNITVQLNVATGLTKLIPADRWYGNEWVEITAEDETSFGTVYVNVTVVKNVTYIPALKNPIPDLTWAEETNYSIDLYDYFDDMQMNFTARGTENIEITIDNSTGNATLVPETNFFGTNHIVFTAANALGSAQSNNVTLTITNVNDPPYLGTPIPTQYFIKDANHTINLSRYFTDVDGDDFNYTSSQPDNVTVYINNATNIATLVPNASFVGTNTVNFTAFESSGLNVSSNEVTLVVLVGNSTILNSYLDGNYYNGSYGIIINTSTVVTSNITNSTVINSTIESGKIANSTVKSSSLVNCTVINSYVVNYVASNCYIENSNIDLSISGGLSTSGIPGVAFNVTGSAITAGSEITSSNVIYSNVTNSTVDYANLTSCNITNSWFRKANASGCNITGYTFRGDITFNGTTNTSITILLYHIINYPPSASFTYSTSGFEVNFTDSSEDLNLGSPTINDNLTYNWSFGDNTYSNLSNPQHNYSSYGSYPVTLAVMDIYGEESIASQTITFSAPGGSSSGGGGGGGGVCSDECTLGTAGCTEANAAVTCGNYDSDSCLEWGNAVPCGENAECVSGICQAKVCVEDWVCSAWSDCAGSTQSRDCADYNGCGTLFSMPPTSQSCVVPAPEVEAPAPPRKEAPLPVAVEEKKLELLGVGIWEFAVIVLMAMLLLTGSIAVLRTVGSKRRAEQEYTRLDSLKSAIRRDLVRGVREQDIRSLLIETGWPDYMVNQALKEIHDSILNEPVERDISKGADEAMLRGLLVSKGWPKSMVDGSIEDVNLSILKRAMSSNLDKGFSVSQVREGLVGRGWPDYLVDRAVKELKR